MGSLPRWIVKGKDFKEREREGKGIELSALEQLPAAAVALVRILAYLQACVSSPAQTTGCHIYRNGYSL